MVSGQPEAFTSGNRAGAVIVHASTLSNPASCLRPISITAVPDGELRAPYFMQWSFALEQQFGTTMNLRAQYVGTRAVNQPYETQVNGYQTVCQSCFAPFPYGQPSDPRFGAVTQLSTGANSHYNGLQLTADKRLTRGLQVLANYTWSRCMDTVSNGGFLPFSAAGILTPLGNLSGNTVLATTMFEEISPRNTSISCRSKPGAERWGRWSMDGKCRGPHSGTVACRSRY